MGGPLQWTGSVQAKAASVSARIVILGGGFAAVAAAHRLERLLRPDEAEITLISRENFTLFTPMLPEVSSGELDVRHIVTPIRAQLGRTRFVLGEAQSVDLEQRRITFTHTLRGDRDTAIYDHVVFAVGSVTSTFGLPGVAERVFALKTLEDAGVLRNRFMWLLELGDSLTNDAARRALLTIVVVGGGFTGVEATGEMAELFADVLRFYPRIHRGDVRIVLVEGGDALVDTR
ncbi:MAG: hypothetical protein NVS1B14_08770 [Vulcanimicrobiaceae bacterium]